MGKEHRRKEKLRTMGDTEEKEKRADRKGEIQDSRWQRDRERSKGKIDGCDKEIPKNVEDIEMIAGN